MTKVTIVQVIYNHKKFIEPIFTAIFNQTYKDFKVVAVISGNEDGGKELLQEKFPQVEIVDPGYNIGFAKGHNLVFAKYNSEFFQLVNPDLILEPDYIENILKAFENPKIGAATGKLLRYDFKNNKKTNIIDSTGVVVEKSGRGSDRGQHEEDRGQYDNSILIQASSGAGPMYRKSALESIKYINKGEVQFFDEDFHSYWEDVDLGLRMGNAGWESVFAPSALGYHGRGAGSHKGGYKDIWGFVKFHKSLPLTIRKLNYTNHIFMYIKNTKWLYPQFYLREFLMLIYLIMFERDTLRVVPQMLKFLPTMWKKRDFVKRI